MLFFMTVISFVGSANGRDDTELYRQITKHLETYGQVLKGSTNWLDQAHVVVADVTPSFEVGFKVGRALGSNKGINGSDRKDILCLYRPSGRGLPLMIEDCEGCENLTMVPYNGIEEARRHIDDFFTKRRER